MLGIYRSYAVYNSLDWLYKMYEKNNNLGFITNNLNYICLFNLNSNRKPVIIGMNVHQVKQLSHEGINMLLMYILLKSRKQRSTKNMKSLLLLVNKLQLITKISTVTTMIYTVTKIVKQKRNLTTAVIH